ncbi:hypothetical protein ACIPUC_14775 [Streptomyces sp. LARHCF249]
MSASDGRHWSRPQYLHEVVTNPNIHVRGTHSYCSNAWSGDFEGSVVRYLYGDAVSLASWEPAWPIDQLHGVVTRDVAPTRSSAAAPAAPVRTRFAPGTVDHLLDLDVYSWNEEKFTVLRETLCAADIDALEEASRAYDRRTRTVR